MSTKILCPGSGERSDRVHASGAVMCPSCNGAYLSAGMTVPDHECEAEKPTELESLLGAIARGWCHPENAHKVMDEELAEAIADEVLPLLVVARERTDQEHLRTVHGRLAEERDALVAERDRLRTVATRFRRAATLIERTEKTILQWPTAEVDAFIAAFPISEDGED